MPPYTQPSGEPMYVLTTGAMGPGKEYLVFDGEHWLWHPPYHELTHALSFSSLLCHSGAPSLPLSRHT